jgi:hypothetical protein
MLCREVGPGRSNRATEKTGLAINEIGFRKIAHLSTESRPAALDTMNSIRTLILISLQWVIGELPVLIIQLLGTPDLTGSVIHPVCGTCVNFLSFCRIKSAQVSMLSSSRGPTPWQL